MTAWWAEEKECAGRTSCRLYVPFQGIGDRFAMGGLPLCTRIDNFDADFGLFIALAYASVLIGLVWLKLHDRTGKSVVIPLM